MDCSYEIVSALEYFYFFDAYIMQLQTLYVLSA